MAVIPGDIAQPFIRRETTVGPVTSARHRRNAMIYAAMCILGLLPTLFGMSPEMQAAGLGLWIPGGGFLAVGGWAILLFPVTIALFAVAVFAWFGAGMVLAPIIVWLGAALLAGHMVAEQTWLLAPYLVAATVAGIGIYAYQRNRARKTAELAKLEARKRSLGTAIAEAIEVAAPRPTIAERELTPDDLAALRYGFDRALQPVGQMNGYEKVDQFQTSALRPGISSLPRQSGRSLAPPLPRPRDPPDTRSPTRLHAPADPARGARRGRRRRAVVRWARGPRSPGRCPRRRRFRAG